MSNNTWPPYKQQPLSAVIFIGITAIINVVFNAFLKHNWYQLMGELMRSRIRAVFGVAVLIFSLITVAVPKAASAASDTCTWTGTASANWSNGSNWTGCDNGGVPQAGDSLMFPADTSHVDMNNDLGLTFSEITFHGDGYTVSGSTVDVSLSLNIYSAVSFVTGVSFTASSGNTTLSYQDPAAILPTNISLNLTGGANFQLFSTVDNLPIPTFSGTVNRFTIVGSPTGAQRTFIAINNSTFTASGGVTLARATVLCESNNCLGNSSNAVTISNGNNRGSELNLWTDSLTVPYDITFNDNGFAGPATLSASGADESLTGNIHVNSNSNLQVNGGHTLTIGGTGKTLDIPTNKTLAVVGGDYNDKVLIQNEVTGGGVLNVVSATVVATGNNAAYDGRVVVDDGGVYNGSSASLGTAAGDIAVNSGGTWVLNNTSNESINDHITIDGSGSSYTPAAIVVKNHNVTFSSLISIGGDTTIDNSSSTGAVVDLASNVIGSGNITLTRSVGNTANAFHLSADNSFTGDVTIKGTNLSLDGNGTNIPGNLSIQATSTANALVTVNNTNVFGNNSVISTAKNGSHTATFAVDTSNTSVSMITGNGTIGFLASGQNLQIGNNNASGTFAGTFAGTGNTITKVGTGTWNLDAASYATTGDNASFVINGGTISFNGSLAGSPVTVASGSTLKGTGTIGAATIQDGATVSIGNSPGCMTMSALNLANGATYQQQITGSTACSEYDQATITGAANLNNAHLNVELTYTPTTSTTFTILKAGSVNGTFNGLPNGATVVVNGVTLRINYTATAVTLTYVSGSTTGSLVDTGLSLIGPAGIAIVLISAAILVVKRRKQFIA